MKSSKRLIKLVLIFILCQLTISYLTSCRSKVSSKNMGVKTGISATVVNTSDQKEVAVENSRITIEPGTFDNTVYVEVKPVEDTSIVTDKTDNEIASDVIDMTTLDENGNPISKVNKEIVVTFTVESGVEIDRLEGLIITKPDGRVIKIAHSDLTIKQRDDGKYDVSFKTKEVNAVFTLVVGDEIIAEQRQNQINGSPRTYYQTRSVISLKIEQDSLSGANTFSVDNDDTGIKLVDQQPISFGLFDGFNLLPSKYDESMLLLSFYPLDPEVRAAFKYGENNITLSVDHPTYPIYSKTKIYIKDFDIFETAYLSFSTNRQVISTNGKLFQGWLNVVSNPRVTSGETTLTTGMPNIVND